MRSFLAFLGAALLVASPASAHIARPQAVSAAAADDRDGGERLVEVAGTSDDAVPEVRGIAAFGPFRVIDAGHAALVRETDSASPAAFAEMLRAWPGIRTIRFVECPGTLDDVANLRLGRMIRERGLDTEVPDGGSVRSGAVELFLAGAHRKVDPEAEFAVHSWRDEHGREPRDVPAADPVNRTYIAYYRQMGLTPANAEAFYALTNSVSNDDALWLKKADIAKYVTVE